MTNPIPGADADDLFAAKFYSTTHAPSNVAADEVLCGIVDRARDESDAWAESLSYEPNGTESNADFCRRVIRAAAKVGANVAADIPTWQERRADWLKRHSQKREGPPSNDPFTTAEIADLRVRLAAGAPAETPKPGWQMYADEFKVEPEDIDYDSDHWCAFIAGVNAAQIAAQPAPAPIAGD